MDVPAESFLSAEKKKFKKLVKRHLKATKKYLLKCQEALNHALAWQKEYHQAELLSSYQYLLNKGLSEISLPDWEQEGRIICMALDPRLKPHEEIAARFKKSKKLKASQEPLQRQLLLAQQELNKQEALLIELEAIVTEEELLAFKAKTNLNPQQAKKKNQREEPPLPFYEFFSASGLSIWVGKNAKGNDLLTFRYAKGNDHWMHINEYPGSHVVLRTSGKEIDEEALQDALQLALFFSKGRESSKAEIALTQKKYVTKLGKEAGKVQISRKKNIFVNLDKERIQEIKARLKARKH
ncbi:hypothetical protein PHSC3_000878 [Chlamydiales bacterium STE3]|nr:hypothetical protein PHSC3_000878 [Chlamydiales bacterium STE3]